MEAAASLPPSGRIPSLVTVVSGLGHLQGSLQSRAPGLRVVWPLSGSRRGLPVTSLPPAAWSITDTCEKLKHIHTDTSRVLKGHRGLFTVHTTKEVKALPRPLPWKESSVRLEGRCDRSAETPGAWLSLCSVHAVQGPLSQHLGAQDSPGSLRARGRRICAGAGLGRGRASWRCRCSAGGIDGGAGKQGQTPMTAGVRPHETVPRPGHFLLQLTLLGAHR